MYLTYLLKNVRIQSFSDLHFPPFGLNSERYGVYSEIFIYSKILVSLRILSECGKIRIRKTTNTDTFHAVLPSTSNIIYRMTKTMEKFAKSVTCHRLKHSTKNFNLNFLFVKMNKYAGNCLFVLTRKKNPETKASCFSYWGT